MSKAKKILEKINKVNEDLGDDWKKVINTVEDLCSNARGQLENGELYDALKTTSSIISASQALQVILDELVKRTKR